MFSIIISIAWGIAGYLLLSFLVSETGGGSTLSIVIGVVGFILVALISFGGRSLGRHYYDDKSLISDFNGRLLLNSDD